MILLGSKMCSIESVGAAEETFQPHARALVRRQQHLRFNDRAAAVLNIFFIM